MNKHIEKFARECGAWNQVYGNRTFMIDEHFDIEKFAGLIVRECAKVVFEKTGPKSALNVLEHFGVEE